MFQVTEKIFYYKNFYLGSQVVIQDTSLSERRCVLRSKKNYTITDIQIMGRTDRYVCAHTPNTMILADMNTNLVIKKSIKIVYIFLRVLKFCGIGVKMKNFIWTMKMFV